MSHIEGIPSRRGLLARGTAALLAGAAIATTARSAPVAPPEGAGDDAELIAACDKLIANRLAWITLIMSRHTLEDERRTEPENQRLCAEYHSIVERMDATPSTLAGAQALARAAIAAAERDMDGYWESRTDSEWLALSAAEYLAEDEFGDRLVRLLAVTDDDTAGRTAA